MTIKSTIILLLAALASCPYVQAKTIEGKEFYGTWSTASSILKPKRQILTLSKKGGRWTLIKDDGSKSSLELHEEDISIKNDLLIVDYRDKEAHQRLKLVLGGWSLGGSKMIFGTVYMYADEDRDGKADLYNGIPVTFWGGLEHMPPQVYWKFFLSDEIQHVDKSYIAKLETDLQDVKGVAITKGNDGTNYYLKRISAVITVTNKGSPAYPAAVGVQGSHWQSYSIHTAAKYAGNKAEFKRYYKSYLHDIETAKQISRKHLEQLMRKIEETISEKQKQNN